VKQTEVPTVHVSIPTGSIPERCCVYDEIFSSRKLLGLTEGSYKVCLDYLILCLRNTKCMLVEAILNEEI